MSTKANEKLILATVLGKIDSRRPTPKQLAFLAKAGVPAAEIERLTTIRAASAKIRLIIEDRQPSPDETGVVEADDREPTDAQLELLQRLIRRLGPDCGVTIESLLAIQKDQASDLIDHLLAAASTRRAAARSEPATERQVAFLVRSGLDEPTARSLTRGVASDAIARLVKRVRAN